MTRETDNIIDYFRAADVAGKITELNKPGSHTKLSYHYKPGTPSPRVEPLDRYAGRRGQAVDIGLGLGKPDDPLYAAIFEPVESQLTELIHSGPSITYFIHNGERVPIKDLSAAVKKIHYNHVHVAVAKGTFLVWPGTRSSTPITTMPPPSLRLPPQPPGDDDMADARCIEYPDGSKTLLEADSIGIFNAGTPFFGTMFDLAPRDKQGFVSMLSQY